MVNDLQVFSLLCSAKKLYLIYEAEFGTLEANEFFDKRCNAALSEISSVEHMCYFIRQLEKDYYKNYYSRKPEGDLYDLIIGDYSVYTHDKYGRKFWNEIENPPFLEMLLKKLIYILPNVKWSMPYDYCLVLYDFNDLDIYFETEEAVDNFIDKFDVAPATLFVMDKTGHYVESWSI